MTHHFVYFYIFVEAVVRIPSLQCLVLPFTCTVTSARLFLELFPTVDYSMAVSELVKLLQLTLPSSNYLRQHVLQSHSGGLVITCYIECSGAIWLPHICTEIISSEEKSEEEFH